jgi:hypothetical protein
LKHVANKIELRKQGGNEKRREDGRLCLLVHDLEQFIVDKVQSFPYSVLDVQILPDLGAELPEGLVDENSGKMTGGAAVRRSLNIMSMNLITTNSPWLEMQLPASGRHRSIQDFPSTAICLLFFRRILLGWFQADPLFF